MIISGEGYTLHPSLNRYQGYNLQLWKHCNQECARDNGRGQLDNDVEAHILLLTASHATTLLHTYISFSEEIYISVTRDGSFVGLDCSFLFIAGQFFDV